MNLHAPARRPGDPGMIRVSTDDGVELPRHRFTVSDCFRMVETGVLPTDYRFELIDGEIVPMSPKSAAHMEVQRALLSSWGRTRPDAVAIMAEPTLPLGSGNFLEPDIFVGPSDTAVRDIRPADALLVVEIAVTSLATDLGQKAALYAAEGVSEYWVIDATSLETHVHRDAIDGHYGSIVTHGAAETLTPLAVPVLALSLFELGLVPAEEEK
ncbi:MAG: Uma2 family endonuclease [Pseudomonadota bacterium]